MYLENSKQNKPERLHDAFYMPLSLVHTYQCLLLICMGCSNSIKGLDGLLTIGENLKDFDTKVL